MRVYILTFLLVAIVVGACSRKQSTSSSTPDNSTAIDTSVAETIVTMDMEADSLAMVMDSKLFLEYVRMPCYGTCPAYTVKIYTDGYATYYGERNVTWLGKHETTFTEDDLTAITEELNNNKFFTLLDEYPEDGIYPTDLPKVMIRAKSNQYDKTVVDNKYKTPNQLLELEKFLEQLINSQNWQQTQ